ncbi:hypothetical protein WDW37_17650, partial [Bdellovibrionota bacterium FG-1]
PNCLRSLALDNDRAFRRSSKKRSLPTPKGMNGHANVQKKSAKTNHRHVKNSPLHAHVAPNFDARSRV